ncbi:uncharacterized protein F4807DRAFT_109687 [Annulohypoxylon truncatum]|uniref:uncharacterized protein n=1 Tax=Annulohypoxylon truncatum TaxID=327061 RepID=UPI002008AB77|nr:uncharacterized protein F4807DRAFT_109687 [Annulohypoxylon truncatum]KAI1209091.1 hypothetical protein F4807DRAFT_109687 [Annulohypoxylon truncatum]
MSSISRLPESTTRLLGSSLVITTPVTLVKELLDNSIDAKASSVEVITSADTVRKIEVRDNGVGIHPDDYDALGRRGHTSKLRSFEELRIQSVKTLGFRGEALASANSLAQVTVTTKIASEPVAAILHIVPGKGGVLKQQPTSAPVGTTVSITSLFGKLPVREQVAIKESAKTIDKIREVLRSYAMARPQLRLSFKVLHSPKQTWSYSPKPEACVKEAAIQLFGAEITTHCFEQTFEINELQGQRQSDALNNPNPPSSGNYVFETLIVKPNCDPSKAPKHQYFSVDGRPITGKGGTMKKLLSIYIEQICTAFRQSSSVTVPRDCFIRLNIKCPPGSYDANVEPSKDDVLFSNENVVLDGFRDLCKEVYVMSTLSNSVEHSSTLDKRDGPATQDSSFTELQGQCRPQAGNRGSIPLQVRDHTTSQPTFSAQSKQESIIDHQPLSIHSQEALQEASDPINIGFTPINTQMLTTQNDSISTGVPRSKVISPNTRSTRCQVDMSTDFNEYNHNYPNKKRTQPSQSHKDGADAVEYSTLQDVNPWAIAKANAPNRSKEQTFRDLADVDSSSLPVLEPSMTPDPPILRHTRAVPRDLDVPLSQQRLFPQGGSRQFRPKVPGGPYHSPMSSPPEIASRKATYSANMSAPLMSRRRRDYAPWSPPSSAERTIPNSDLSLNNAPERASESMKQTQISFKGAARKSKKRRPEEDIVEVDHLDLQDRGHNSENGLQKMLAAARRSLNHQISQEKDSHSSNHKSYEAHIRAKAGAQRQPFTQSNLDHAQAGSSSNIKEPIKTTLPHDDPRAYLLRRQKSMTAQENSAIPKKPRRMKSSLLPLENVPSDNQMHFMVLVEALSIEALRTSMKGGVAYDKYMERGAVKNGLEMDLDTGHTVEDRLMSLLQGRRGMADGEEAELEIGLCSLLKGKGAAVVA